MGKKELANTDARLTKRGRGYLAGKAEEKTRCADIALDMWKKKPAKDAEWYKTVGKEIAAEIEMNGPFGIPIEVSEWTSIEEGLPRVCGKKYLVLGENTLGEKTIDEAFLKWPSTRDRFFHANNVRKITHWMERPPLPAKPKESECYEAEHPEECCPLCGMLDVVCECEESERCV